ncbi:rho-associated protein kinase 1-like [Topomyia yanbarensis]|uniref:rho-associated protein kinase 1-like n=1 Tax=Topomyia yanbarensis TaxID=2498891 RepID=UPI00273C61D2|nr:rho-associated protein kinase 1-like [Topomyia yanbarensis]
MANATFVENWNSIIPHKIGAVELEHPTESFVFRNFISFLKMMKYDVMEFESMYNEPKDVLLLKRASLVAYINHFYQLCLGSKQSTFFYVDLIKPSPKKTIHVLNILLNYLFYVNMVRDDTVERATSCTAKYQELTAKMNQQQCELENHKIKVNTIEQNISKMKDQLPQLERANEKLRSKKKQLQEKILSIKTAESEFVEKITKLKTDFASLKDQRVVDEDAAALIQKNEDLESAIEESEKQEKSLQLANSEYSTLISQIQPCILALEDILQNPLNNSLKAIKHEVDALQLNCNRLEKDCSNKKTILEAMQKNCNSIRDYVDVKCKELTAEQKIKRKTERKTVTDLSEKQMQLDELQEQNDIYVQEIEALKEEILLIMQMAGDTMKFLMRDPVKTGRKLK